MVHTERNEPHHLENMHRNHRLAKIRRGRTPLGSYTRQYQHPGRVRQNPEGRSLVHRRPVASKHESLDQRPGNHYTVLASNHTIQTYLCHHHCDEFSIAVPSRRFLGDITKILRMTIRINQSNCM